MKTPEGLLGDGWSITELLFGPVAFCLDWIALILTLLD
jgi:hypothetical protein